MVIPDEEVRTALDVAYAPDRPPRVLVPFHRAEAISAAEAAVLAGKHERTIRLWCEMHGIGRRVAGGPWRVSRVALGMLLDGDRAALQAYLQGDRTSPAVVAYFDREGLGRLIRLWTSKSEMSETAT